jgi:uncharacterized protein with FMN-binding domain
MVKEVKNWSEKVKSAAILGIFLTFIFTGCIKIDVSTPDISNKPDGVYRGEYNSVVVLDVTVQNQYMTEIKIIEHKFSPIGKQAEKIIERIIKKQSLNVDAVTGATASSKAILKATENALQ